MKVIKYLFLSGLIIFVLLTAVFIFNFLGPGGSKEKERFVIQPKTVFEDEIVNELVRKGFLKNKGIFDLIFDIKAWHGRIEPGAYLISKNMNAYQLANVMVSGPYQKWVVVPPGKRKEQVAVILQRVLNWDYQKLVKFSQQAPEGYLFPDTYLLTVDADTDQSVRVMKTNLDRYFDANLQKEALSQNIKYDTVLKIASIIERESGSDEDKPVIAAVIWNRLNRGMKLQIDATVQYAWANELCTLKTSQPAFNNCNFWPIIPPRTVRTINSGYNTYLYQGLPPGPIANPSLASIKAVLYPATVDALYYLHSSDKQIHTAKTLKEHSLNIEKYLN